MQPFVLERARDVDDAIARRNGSDQETDYMAGGTDLMQLLTDDIRRPARVIALRHGAFDDRIELTADGALHLGAAATMSDVADHAGVHDQFPMVAEALLLSASAQVRNMATVAGNLLQRTRCMYYRNPAVAACNKRHPGSGCAALDGEQRMLAVLGGSEHCLATHASDFAVPLVALDAIVHLRGPDGERTIQLHELYRLPGSSPHVETLLEPGEIITAIEIPASRAARHSRYLKVRDRVSFEFALVSAAVALDIQGRQIREARIAMGGVGTRPWRMQAVEEALVNAPNHIDSYRTAAEHATEGAVPRAGNAFKLELMKRTLVRALQLVGGEV